MKPILAALCAAITAAAVVAACTRTNATGRDVDELRARVAELEARPTWTFSPVSDRSDGMPFILPATPPFQPPYEIWCGDTVNPSLSASVALHPGIEHDGIFHAN